MSVKIMSQCWAVKLPTATHKLILLKFADHANDDGLAYPGATGIAEAVGIEIRQTRKVIGDLRRWGFLHVHEPENSITKKPITYRVTPAFGNTPAVKCTSNKKSNNTITTPALQNIPVAECTPALQRRDPCTTVHHTPALQCTQTIIEPSLNHQSNINPPTPFMEEPSPSHLAMADPGGAITFEEFWNAYPKPSGRAAAKTEYLKTLAQGNVDHAAIIIGCRKYAAFYQNGGVEYRYIPNPAKWLESEGWRHDYRLPDKASQPGASYGDKLFAAAALTRPHDSD